MFNSCQVDVPEVLQRLLSRRRMTLIVFRRSPLQYGGTEIARMLRPLEQPHLKFRVAVTSAQLAKLFECYILAELSRGLSCFVHIIKKSPIQSCRRVMVLFEPLH